MFEWHLWSTCFPSSDISNNFLDFLHYCVSFMAFQSTVDVAVLQNRHSLSMHYRCHATKRSGEVHIQNILIVHQLSTEKYRLKFFHWPKWVCNYHHTNALYIMGNHCIDQLQHKFHPHFYSNAFPLLSQILRLSFHTIAWHTNNLNTSNFCH